MSTGLNTFLTGDNLDIYVKTLHLSKDRRHKDLHVFTSNVIFSRVATVDMSNVAPNVDTADLNCDKVLMAEQSQEKAKFMHAYSVLLKRILCKLSAFKRLISLYRRTFGMFFFYHTILAIRLELFRCFFYKIKYFNNHLY